MRWQMIGYLLFWGLGGFVMIVDDASLAQIGIAPNRRLPIFFAFIFIGCLINIGALNSALGAAIHPIRAIQKMLSRYEK